MRLQSALCGPDVSAFTKECVFVSEDFRWSSAQQEKSFPLLPIPATKCTYSSGTCIVEIVCCVEAAENQEMNTFIAGK